MIDDIRIQMTITILSHYYNLLNENTKEVNEASSGASVFLNEFRHVYTTNYDPIIYKAFMQLEDRNFKDGMSQCINSEIDIDVVIKEIEGVRNKKTDKMLYFLHGAYHLFKSRDDKEITKRKLNESAAELNRFTQNISDNDIAPLIVMAGRFDFKEVFIKKNKYLTKCFDWLSEEKSIFVFGLSFEKDDHILKRLFEGETKNIYISFRSDCDNRRIIEMCEEGINLGHNLFFVDCRDEDQQKYIREKIWKLDN